MRQQLVQIDFLSDQPPEGALKEWLQERERFGHSKAPGE